LGRRPPGGRETLSENSIERGWTGVRTTKFGQGKGEGLETCSVTRCGTKERKKKKGRE